MVKKCKHCREFFKRYRCAKDTIGECDCPKCQGYCECYLLEGEEPPGFEDDGRSQEAANDRRAPKQ